MPVRGDFTIAQWYTWPTWIKLASSVISSSWNFKCIIYEKGNITPIHQAWGYSVRLHTNAFTMIAGSQLYATWGAQQYAWLAVQLHLLVYNIQRLMHAASIYVTICKHILEPNAWLQLHSQIIHDLFIKLVNQLLTQFHFTWAQYLYIYIWTFYSKFNSKLMTVLQKCA